MQKRNLISMFMESPFYFDLSPRERLFLLKDHGRRFSRLAAAGNHDPEVSLESLTPASPPGSPRVVIPSLTDRK
jgi:hypothetical protein